LKTAALDSIPFSRLEEDAEDVVRQVRRSEAPTVITREGKAEIVLLGIELFEKTQEERDLLLRLAHGEREIAAGVGFDLDEVLAEADGLLRHRRA
jgi:prevent-host-death family protein